ncbi:MAG: hypothetical protein RLZZ262_172 [Bacteroidota bacterium]
MRLQRLLTFVLVYLWIHPMVLSAQEKAPLLEVWEMSDDIDSLYAQIMEAHPDPFFFCSPQKLQQTYYSICDQIDHPMTRFEFAGIANQLTKVIEDSHTGLDYTQMSALAFERGKRILPINVITDSEYRIIVKNAWDSLVPPGWVIRSINGHDAQEAYLIGLHQYSYTEADAKVSKQRIADALWALIVANTMDLDSINAVELEDPATHQVKKIDVAAYESAKYYKIRKERIKKGYYESLVFKLDGDNDYAYLRVGTFAPTQKKQFRKQIRNAFKEIQNSGVHHLILDISGNGGGSSDNVEYLYSFIDSTGYNTPHNVIGIHSRLSDRRSQLAAKRAVKWMLRTFWSGNEDVAGYLKIADLPLGDRDTAFFSEPTVQKNYVFNGEVYLLINGMTASAGVDFTNAFRQRERGIIIGEPCMGPISGTFGNPALFKLKNSGLKFYIATIRYNYDGSFMRLRMPIMPDVFVPILPDDIVNNYNCLIEEALQQIEQP